MQKDEVANFTKHRKDAILLCAYQAGRLATDVKLEQEQIALVVRLARLQAA